MPHNAQDGAHRQSGALGVEGETCFAGKGIQAGASFRFRKEALAFTLW